MSIARKEHQQTPSVFETVVYTLEKRSIPYYIVGNCAVDAVTGNICQRISRILSSISEDVDIITPVPSEVKISLGQVNMRETWQENLHLQERKSDLGINKIIDLSDPKNPHLRYKDIFVNLPEEIFTPYRTTFYGINFTTLHPKTLLYLYNLSWHLGESQKQNIQALQQWLDDHPENDLPDILYAGFSQFNKERKERYPVTSFVRKCFLVAKFGIAEVLHGKEYS